MATKGNKVEFNTFNKWGSAVEAHIGYNIEETDGRKYVKFVWCRLCAKYKDKLVAHPNLRGAAKKSVESYASGTNTVTKSNILRHLDGKAHALALMLDKDSTSQHSSAGDGDNEACELPSAKQPRIDTFLDKSARDGYKKLLRTAYELALNAMPFNEFKVLVKVQKENGLSTIQGKDNSRVATEMVNLLAQAIKEKLAVILESKKVFSSLSDGSQSRKTGADMELIFVRVERGGLPVYYCLGLEDLSEYGGANAEGIKAAHDKVFSFLEDKVYKEGLVSCTADGASVNFGRQGGFLTKMTETRPWLLSLHCVNHKAELAAKSVFEKTRAFQEVDDLYIGIRSLLNNSGRLKAELKNSCQSLDITYYSLQKLHGTRFQHQRRKGFKRFLHMWIPITNTFENAVCQPSNNYRQETRAKMAGYLKKLKRFDLVVYLSLYFDVLDTVGILSLIFEKKNILVCEVEPARDKTLVHLNNLLEESISEYSQASKHFCLVSNESNYQIEKQVPIRGHVRKKEANRNYTTLSMPVTHVAGIDQKVTELKNQVITELKEKYLARFESFEDPIIQAMLVIDPKFWDTTDSHYGEQELLFLADFFDVPLGLLDFDRSKVISEWKTLKHLVLKFYPSHSVEAIWPKIFEYRFKEYPNICKIMSVVISVSVSNSTVERGFSALTLILSDRRLHLLQKNMEAMLVVKVNHLVWTELEREEIINRALELYMFKRRTKQLTESASVSEQLEYQLADDSVHLNSEVESSDDSCQDFSESDSNEP